MTLADFINQIYVNGGDMSFELVYDNMNFSGKSTDTDFDSSSFNVVNNLHAKEIRIRSEYWEPVD